MISSFKNTLIYVFCNITTLVNSAIPNHVKVIHTEEYSWIATKSYLLFLSRFEVEIEVKSLSYLNKGAVETRPSVLRKIHVVAFLVDSYHSCAVVSLTVLLFDSERSFVHKIFKVVVVSLAV